MDTAANVCQICCRSVFSVEALQYRLRDVPSYYCRLGERIVLSALIPSSKGFPIAKHIYLYSKPFR
jgi:hypothetical protein